MRENHLKISQNYKPDLKYIIFIIKEIWNNINGSNLTVISFICHSYTNTECNFLTGSKVQNYMISL